ncbi:MAG: TonB-dependent receptor [Rhodothermales bacterium]
MPKALSRFLPLVPGTAPGSAFSHEVVRVAFGWLLFLSLAGFTGLEARAQTATLNGFVTDRSDGSPLELVNLVLQNETSGAERGVVTNREGSYLIARLQPGRYVLQASFVGFETYRDTLNLAGGEVETLNIQLNPGDADLDEILVQTERTDGAARVTAGRQTIRPAEIERIPTLDASGDLAAYLSTLPGVVSTGDQGGQLFIRGGEPSQNLVLLDGMTLYQPFHILGFYSAFPADMLNKTDIYAGGFPSRFGGRLSSVIDVASRNGNNRRFAGGASLSPFISEVRLEGPIVPGKLSFLASVRESFVEEGAQRLVDAPMPFSFGDMFAKLHAAPSENSRLSISAIRTHDRGTLGEVPQGGANEEVRWNNEAIGLRYLILPRILPVLADLKLSYSGLTTELGPGEEPTRSSSISGTHLTLDATFFGSRTDVEAGMELRFVTVSSELGGLYQNVENARTQTDLVAYYVQPEFRLGGGFSLQPGLRLQFYHVRFDPYLEPRLRVSWERGVHEISAAAGIYYQELVGLSDRRDASSVFTAWSVIPKSGPRVEDIRAGRVPSAVHAILGYRTAPTSWLELSVEGFYKELKNLVVAEWTAFPRFTTRLQPASGRSSGFDARLELRQGPFYSYINYGLSSTRYEAEQAALQLWYGEEALSYRPPHDRRHQLNAVASTSFFGFDANLRWEFGSGLPFSQAYGFDGFVLVNDVTNVAKQPSSRRVIYERPYNAVLPAYHRLDLSLARTFDLGRTAITIQGSVINVYDRRNIFYFDIFTLERINQLPRIPSLSLKIDFE